MSGLCTGRIALVTSTPSGLNIDGYRTELECVLDTINNGRLGSTYESRTYSWWGSPEHKKAVLEVIEASNKVLQNIIEQEAHEAAEGAE